MKIDFTTDLPTLGQAALKAMLAGENLTLVLPDFWERPRDFPLPVVRDKTNQEQPYRPIAVLEWIASEAKPTRAPVAAVEDDDEL